MPVAVCANLPYYITSPILMGLLESRLPFTTITVLVQKEAAQRLCAKPGTKGMRGGNPRGAVLCGSKDAVSCLPRKLSARP